MLEIVELEEIIVDVAAFVFASKLEGTLEPSEEALKVAHVLLSLSEMDKNSAEYSLIVATIYSLASLGYLAVTVGVGEE